MSFRTLTFLGLALVASPVLAGRALLQDAGCKQVTTQEGFSLDAYIAKRWFVQQQQPITYLPEAWNHCVTALYEKRSNPTIWGHTIQVRNFAREADGTEHSTGDNLCAAAVDADPAKLQVGPCFLPRIASVTVGPYWVLEYNETEGYALVSGGQPSTPTDGGCVGGTGVNDSGLWIFTRAQQRDPTLVAKVRALAVAQGFDVSVLKDVDQSGCPAFEANDRLSLHEEEGPTDSA